MFSLICGKEKQLNKIIFGYLLNTVEKDTMYSFFYFNKMTFTNLILVETW